jgi:hypothetical protein
VTALYINYPNARFSLYPGTSLSACVVQDKPNRRTIRISPETFSVVLQHFVQGKIDFASTCERNDFWLDLDFDDQKFEKALAEHLQRLLGRRYGRLGAASWS